MLVIEDVGEASKYQHVLAFSIVHMRTKIKTRTDLSQRDVHIHLSLQK